MKEKEMKEKEMTEKEMTDKEMTDKETNLSPTEISSLVQSFPISTPRRTDKPISEWTQEGVLEKFDECDDPLFWYIQLAQRTAIYPEAGQVTAQSLSYVGLGLVGEAGEVANKVKKILRDDDGKLTESRRKELSKELGDVFWYLGMLCLELSLDERQILRDNLEKLYDRKDRGVLGGSGDNR